MKGEPDKLISPLSKAAGLNRAACVNPIRRLLSEHLDLLLEDENVCVVCLLIPKGGFCAFFPPLPDIKAAFWSCCSIHHTQIANGVPGRDLMTSQEARTIKLFGENDEKYSSFSHTSLGKTGLLALGAPPVFQTDVNSA